LNATVPVASITGLKLVTATVTICKRSRCASVTRNVDGVAVLAGGMTSLLSVVGAAFSPHADR
jgi:hypothetical protein